MRRFRPARRRYVPFFSSGYCIVIPRGREPAHPHAQFAFVTRECFVALQGTEMEIQGDDDLKKLALKMANVRPDPRMYGK